MRLSIGTPSGTFQWKFYRGYNFGLSQIAPRIWLRVRACRRIWHRIWLRMLQFSS